MVGSLRNNVLNSYIQGNEKVVVSKNPGATSKQIAHNCLFNITQEAPKTLVVVAGTNDILQQSRGGNIPNEASIVNDIMSIGSQAKTMGVEMIHISSIVVMSNPRLDNIRKRVNRLLYTRCLEEGYGYIDNSNIKKADLSRDNLHLSRDGLAIFMDNILGSCFYSYNPYLADFYDQISGFRGF